MNKQSICGSSNLLNEKKNITLVYIFVINSEKKMKKYQIYFIFVFKNWSIFAHFFSPEKKNENTN